MKDFNEKPEDHFKTQQILSTPLSNRNVEKVLARCRENNCTVQNIIEDALNCYWSPK